MPQTNYPTELAAQKRLASRYKSLGYDVQENPGPDRLPDFMHGAAPDIVARSLSDNVVIKIKRHASLKGSNDIVGIAERISVHPDWRFELVVIKDERADGAASEKNYQILLDKVHAATSNRLFDVAYIYLVTILVQMARDLWRKNNAALSEKGDRSLFIDMGFKGILPDRLVEQCLSALSMRVNLATDHTAAASLSETEVQGLLRLCDEVRGLL